MANINLSQKSYVDYVASLYFKAMNVVNLTITPKTVKVGDEDVVLAHLSGVQTSSGVVVNIDLWPRNNATEEDLKSLPKSFDDIIFRVGYWPKVDENGESSLEPGAPKWISYTYAGKETRLSGEKREREFED